jgi:hypothetical protein
MELAAASLVQLPIFRLAARCEGRAKEKVVVGSGKKRKRNLLPCAFGEASFSSVSVHMKQSYDDSLASSHRVVFTIYSSHQMFFLLIN